MASGCDQNDFNWFFADQAEFFVVWWSAVICGCWNNGDNEGTGHPHDSIAHPLNSASKVYLKSSPCHVGHWFCCLGHSPWRLGLRMMNQMQWLCVRPVHRAASVHLNLILVINRILKFVKGTKNSVCRILKVDFYRISKTDCLIRQTGFWRLTGPLTVLKAVGGNGVPAPGIVDWSQAQMSGISSFRGVRIEYIIGKKKLLARGNGETRCVISYAVSSLT